jgi:hypothetical protein
VDDTLAFLMPDTKILKRWNSEELFTQLCKRLGIDNFEGERAVQKIRRASYRFINGRSIALNALREGITLDGKLVEGGTCHVFCCIV